MILYAFHFQALSKNIVIEKVIQATKNDKKMKAGKRKYILLER